MPKASPGNRAGITAALILFSFPLLADSSADVDQARKLYQLTDYQNALKILEDVQPKDGPVYAWIGRNHYMQGEYKKATENLEKAVAADPANSDLRTLAGPRIRPPRRNCQPFHRACTCQ